MTDLERLVWDQLTNGAPMPPKPTDADWAKVVTAETKHPLPTEPGVYIIDRPHHHEHDHWWVGSAIFELSRTGYWAVDRKPRTADEVDAIRHGQALIALVPTSEGDR